MLHVFNEFTHAQIAQHLGISVSMVEKHMVRAMLASRARERELHARGWIAAHSCVSFDMGHLLVSTHRASCHALAIH